MRAPSASSAAAGSDGCAEAQRSLPKIACSRCCPPFGWKIPRPGSQQENGSRQYQHLVACRRLPPIVPIERSCGEAAWAQASRSAAGICGSTSSSARVVPAPMRVPSIPRGTASARWTSVSARTIRSRRSGTRSVPPARATEPLLRERMPDRLDDSPLDLACRAERVDDPPDVVDRVDALDPHLAGLDVDRDLGHLRAEGEHPHPRRVRPPRALAEDLRVLEQAGHFLERPRAAVRGDDVPVLEVEHTLLEVEALRRDLEDLPLRVGRRRASSGSSSSRAASSSRRHSRPKVPSTKPGARKAAIGGRLSFAPYSTVRTFSHA